MITTNVSSALIRLEKYFYISNNRLNVFYFVQLKILFIEMMHSAIKNTMLEINFIIIRSNTSFRLFNFYKTLKTKFYFIYINLKTQRYVIVTYIRKAQYLQIQNNLYKRLSIIQNNV